MEDGLVRAAAIQAALNGKAVLILIVMEDGLVLEQSGATSATVA